MPSYARHHQLEKDIYYHILNRSNRQIKIFHSEDDYKCFKDILSRYRTKRGLDIYNYSIMSNHYHLKAELADPEEISSIFAGINKSYSHHYHKRYKMSGFLWQGRFKSKPIQKDIYSLGCGRYIEMNPVSAKMVKYAEDYPHSSARYYVLGAKDELVTEDPLYADFGRNDEERRKNYRIYLLDFDSEEEELYNDLENPLGGGEFLKKLIKQNGRLVPRRQGRSRG